MTRNGLHPEELLEISGGYWKSCILHAAVALDVFTAFGKDALTAAEAAQRISARGRGVPMLLNALTAMGLLVKEEDRYQNAEISRAFLCKDSAEYVGHMILHHRDLVPSWAKLDRAVRTGKPVRGRASSDGDEYRESFLMGMFNMAMAIAPRLAEQLDLEGRRRLLDLGGGPGTYAIYFCLENPELRATVYDLPTTRPFAEKTIRQFGVVERVSFQPGNYLKDPIEGSYDVVWLSQVLHGEGPDACERLIQKAVSVLEPGGIVMIHEFLLDDTLDGPLFPAIFSLNMLLGTREGQSYSRGQLREMLEGAGLRDIVRLPFRGPNETGIVAGVK